MNTKLIFKVNYHKNLNSIVHSTRRGRIYNFNAEKLNEPGHNILKVNTQKNKILFENEWKTFKDLEDENIYDLFKNKISSKFEENNLKFENRSNQKYLKQYIVGVSSSFFENKNILNYNKFEINNNFFNWGIKEIFDHKALVGVFDNIFNTLNKELSDQYKNDNFIGGVLHLDEKSPHMHLFYLTIEKNMEKSRIKSLKNINYSDMRFNIIKNLNKGLMLEKENQINYDYIFDGQKRWKQNLIIEHKDYQKLLNDLRTNRKNKRQTILKEYIDNLYDESELGKIISQSKIKNYLKKTISEEFNFNNELRKNKTITSNFLQKEKLYEFTYYNKEYENKDLILKELLWKNESNLFSNYNLKKLVNNNFKDDNSQIKSKILYENATNSLKEFTKEINEYNLNKDNFQLEKLLNGFDKVKEIDQKLRIKKIELFLEKLTKYNNKNLYNLYIEKIKELNKVLYLEINLDKEINLWNPWEKKINQLSNEFEKDIPQQINGELKFKQEKEFIRKIEKEKEL